MWNKTTYINFEGKEVTFYWQEINGITYLSDTDKKPLQLQFN